ncbi:hypothetical protein [Arthrobacter sp. YD2]|uniref:hypothetical protein n=1 Tax=Arthrobacter sp. YD2 TaxID=3058046 RepID=UPI0025B36E2A|nr:hypothetical protein [Arthrobacter sp. YD2]MDN3905803.1 hypothetical protein [Arthrobacter sp. YD2]
MMIVDGDGPILHFPATATKSVQVPDRQNIATMPAIDVAMAASSQLKRRFPRLITISSQPPAALALLSAHYVVPAAEETSALDQGPGSRLACFGS